jgi:NAD(P)-dependent dehydrogenase (short-subunit alcohol dehydrogenase family)
MAQASNSLPQSTLNTFQPIGASAVHVLARLAAKKAVKEQLRDEGVRVSLVLPREINTKAVEYLALHPELIDEARERAHRLGMFDKPKRRRRS